MSTEQNYVGRGNNATSPPPAAQNAAQPAPSLDGRLLYHQDQLAKANLDLIVQVNSLFAFNEEANMVAVLAGMFEAWLLHEYKDLARNNCDEDLEFWDKYLNQMVHAISTVANLREIISRIEDIEGRIKREGRKHE